MRSPCGILYLVSTPIGHSGDISARALQTLQNVDLIAAEDARGVRILLDCAAIKTPLISVSPRWRQEVRDGILARLQGGEQVAFVVDRGTPCIADPGTELVGAALEMGVSVFAIPGPVAAITALVASGLPARRFAFDGIPPRTRAARTAYFRSLARELRTIVLYESRAYLRSTLECLSDTLGPGRRIAVFRDLTRPSEAVLRGTIEEAKLHFHPKPPRGEYTLVIEGAPEPAEQAPQRRRPQ